MEIIHVIVLIHYGNLVVGNNSGTNITTGENNTLIGEKTGNNLVSGSNNLFLGSSKSLIYKSSAPFDMSNTYYDETSSDPQVKDGLPVNLWKFYLQKITKCNRNYWVYIKSNNW